MESIDVIEYHYGMIDIKDKIGSIIGFFTVILKKIPLIYDL